MKKSLFSVAAVIALTASSPVFAGGMAPVVEIEPVVVEELDTGMNPLYLLAGLVVVGVAGGSSSSATSTTATTTTTTTN